jgi:hypothetical protein
MVRHSIYFRALRLYCSNPDELFNTKNTLSPLTVFHALPITLIFLLSSPRLRNRDRRTRGLDFRHTEIRGLEDGGFKVGLEPAERELGVTGY